MDNCFSQWRRQKIKPAGEVGITQTSKSEMYIIARDLKGQLWEKQEIRGDWSQWKLVEEADREQLDMEYGVLAANHARDGRIAVFGKSKYGEILFSWIDPYDENKTIRWKNMYQAIAVNIAVCERCTGGIEVFRLDTANQLWHSWTNPKGEWSQWQPLGGPISGAMTVTNNKEGFPQVFGKFLDGSLAVRRHHSDGMWGEWVYVRKDKIQKFKSMQDSDGKILLAVLDIEGRIQTCRQKEEADAWEEWELLSTEEYTDFCLVENDQGDAVFLGITNNGTIVRIEEKCLGQLQSLEEIKVRWIESARLIDGTICFIAVGLDGYLQMKEECKDGAVRESSSGCL